MIEFPGVRDAGRPRRPAAVWELDGVLTRRNTVLPFLVRVGGTPAVLAFLREPTITPVLQRTLGGHPVAEIDRVARAYAARVAARLRPDAVARWQWHRRQGHRLVIATASPGLYAHHVGRHLGADAVICTEMTAVNGHLTGALRGGPCRGAEKARRVLAHLTEFPASQVWVYSDDPGLLSLADVAVRVSPRRRLPRPAGG